MVKLSHKEDLSFEESANVMDSIMNGECSPVMISSYLTALATKGETVDEIAGSATEMRNHALKLPGDHGNALEIVGTGGDRSGSFNISTTSSFVVASCGVPVAKHGNRAASSKCGAADVLEALGARLDLEPEQSAEVLEGCGFCFMFAQKYHTSMKYVAPVRREISIRTVFNILGPLTNPAFARNQLSGVYSESMVRPMTDETFCCELRNGEFREYVITPEQFGFTRGRHEDLVGGGPQENAAITRSILSGGERGTKRDAVLINAGAGLYTCGKAESISEGVDMAREAIDSGRALSCLDEYVRLTRSFP